VHCSCGDEYNPQTVMKQMADVLRQMGIHHITIQIQQGQGDCITCCENEGCDHARLGLFRQQEEKESMNGTAGTGSLV
jgi:hypothetical protein